MEIMQDLKSQLSETHKFVREGHIAQTVAVVNGLPGCGKTMLAPIIGAFERVEMMRYNYGLQDVCVLNHLGGLSDNAAAVWVRLKTDLDLYDSMMSRETNFRYSDLSSVWKNSNGFRYFKRLFAKGDGAVIPQIEKEKPILQLVLHWMLGVCKPLFAGLGDRLRFIEVVRHPLYMIRQSYIWMPRAGTDPRMFMFWKEYKGHSVPWFAAGWEDLFIRSNQMDKTIYSIERQWRLGMDVVDRLDTIERARIRIIPFERYVLTPEPFMKDLESFLGSRITSTTLRMMKKQNVPRVKIAQGIALPIYKQYGWKPPRKGASERDELNDRRNFVASQASPEAMKVLDQLSQEYEAKYLPNL